jgi:glycosyltransferase involved in cell wall biosynthesis
LGVADEQVVVGFVGSLKPWHGIDLVIEAVAQARAFAPHLRLVIVGEGPARQAVELAIAKNELQDIAILTGNVPHADVPDYLAAMDITVAPYVAVPGFYFSPLKVFEYMAGGRPVVASRLGQIPDILQDGVTGFLHAPGDVNALGSHILALASHSEMRTEMGRRAACHAQAHHSWANVAARITTLAGQLTTE